MGIFQAIILGVVQGLTEFLPVSSSGHLVALPAVMHWNAFNLQFDVALHMGTLVALAAYFYRDWLNMLLALVGSGPGSSVERQERRRLAITLIAACIPAGLAGVVLEHAAETIFRSPYLVAINLAVIGVIMLLVDRASKGKRNVENANLGDGLFIGLAQVLALIPGVSRSGITIIAGLARNLSREEAARFSFLLSVPITFGAGVFALRDLRGGLPAGETIPFLAGVVSAALVGYLTIAFLLDYLRRHDLRIFVYYRWAFAALIALLALIRG
ncbi:MAG TPA: undecaprenyl-diphosphatase UppP [Armatimonadota bacterium]|nr:undecaprenyl-diphosphatase UppP [Armatimonadota bacterium]